MTSGDGTDEIIESAVRDFRALIERAIESVRTQERSDMERKLLAVLGKDHNVEVPAGTPTSRDVHGSNNPITRATPGTVKPTIERLIEEAWGGISTNDLIVKTGFKENSVRATLTTLGRDGFAEKRGDKWFKRGEAPSNKSEEAS
ncbi:MAG: hypothetical protein WA733_19080 [Methylocystis sp.]